MIAVTTAVVETAAALSTGNVAQTVTNTMTLVDYNYNNGQADAMINLNEVLGVSSTIVNVACTDCYAYSALSLVLQMNIQSYSLKTAQVYAQGDANYKLYMVGSLNGLNADYSAQVRDLI